MCAPPRFLFLFNNVLFYFFLLFYFLIIIFRCLFLSFFPFYKVSPAAVQVALLVDYYGTVLPLCGIIFASEAAGRLAPDSTTNKTKSVCSNV